jgi:hypothetical protein
MPVWDGFCGFQSLKTPASSISDFFIWFSIVIPQLTYCMLKIRRTPGDASFEMQCMNVDEVVLLASEC